MLTSCVLLLTISALQKKLFEVQQGKSVNRLNEANIVELVTALIENGLVELIISGQGYITPKQLDIEIKDEVLVHGGRVSLTDVQSTIRVDPATIDDAVEKVLAADPRKLVLEQGELVADYYLDDVASEVNQELQEEGQITLSKIAGRYNFSADFMASQMGGRLSTIIDGKMEHGGVLYTSAFMDRHLAKMRGIFSAVTSACSIGDMRSTFALQDSLVPKQLNTLVKTGRIKGSFQAGRGLYTPAINSVAQEKTLEDFYRQNGFVDYSMIADLEIKAPAKYAAKKFTDGIGLYTCHCNQQLLKRLEGDVEEAIEIGGWVDVGAIVPVQFEQSDVTKLIELCPLVSKGNKVAVIDSCDGLLVSTAMMVTCRTRFEEEAAVIVGKAAECGRLLVENSASNTSAKATKTSRKSGKPLVKATLPDQDSDDDWVNEGKRSKGRKGKGGKKSKSSAGGHNLQATSKAVGKKGKAGGAASAAEANEAGLKGSAASDLSAVAARLAPSEEQMVTELQIWYEDLGDPQAEAIAAELRPAVLRAFVEAQRSAFASAARARQLAQKQFESKFALLYENFALFQKGAASIEDEALRAQLDGHLLRENAAELVAILVGTQATHAGVAIPGQAAMERTKSDPGVLTIPAELRNASGRKAVLEQLPAKNVSQILTSLGNSLSSKNTAAFEAKLLTACEACDMKVATLDKKKEKQLTFQHRQQLSAQLAAEVQPLKALRLGVQLLTVVRHGAVLDVPNKAIPGLVAYLKNKANEDLDEDDDTMTTLDDYHTLAREYMLLLSASSSGEDTAAEIAAQAKLVELEQALPTFKQFLRNK
eukprot:SAG31_NODE_23_length_33717_cov_17.863585_5_plen_820_part_00